MWRMRGARGEVDEEWLVGSQRLLQAHPGNGFVSHVGDQVIVGVPLQFHLRRAVVKRRDPLVHVAADKTVELLKSTAGRPTIKGARRDDLPTGRFVALAISRGIVTVHPENLRQRRDIVRADRGIPRETSRIVCNISEIDGMLVVATEQSGPAGTADRRGVETVVTQPVIGNTVERRHLNGAAKGRRLPEPHVVDQHHQDIRCPLGRCQLEPWRHLGFPHVLLGDQCGHRLRNREHRPVEFVLCSRRLCSCRQCL